MRVTLLLTLIISLAFANSVEEKVLSLLAPAVTIRNGTVVGSSTGIVDSFKGIPYAQPPVGDLRLRPPQSITKPYGTITAIGVPTACPQFYTRVNTSNVPQDAAGLLLDTPVVQVATVAGEDCLTLNVQRPSTATASSKLPVVLWIYGGGFEIGSTQVYDATKFITQSIRLGKPVIYVAVNYRVGGFGFLAGKEWVQENIAAFGGDPNKVTIWGESAGAISVFDQTIINQGDNLYNGKPLFGGAIMDSGSVVPADPVTSEKAQTVYNTVVSNAGCSDSSDSLACLRKVPYQTLLNAVNSLPAIFGYRSVDLAYLPRPDPKSSFSPVSPEVAVANGSYTKIPIIIGDQEDEGTLFALTQSNITTTDELNAYLESYWPGTGNATVAGLVATYPDDPAAGSPFNTGAANEIYPQFKRLAAILGDKVFTLARRVYLNSIASQVPAWSYLATYLYGTPVLGTFHGTDVLEAYYGTPAPVPAQSMQTSYISFINYLDPNELATLPPQWPR